MVKYSLPDEQERIPYPWCIPAYIAAYLYGSLPLVYFLGRQSGKNLKQSGSGNVGATNLLATGGLKRAVIGGVFDASKGDLPILSYRKIGYYSEVAEIAGVSGVVGRSWSYFLTFSSGVGFC